jgi:hypothetical protein
MLLVDYMKLNWRAGMDSGADKSASLAVGDIGAGEQQVAENIMRRYY